MAGGEQRRVVVVGYDGAELLDIACVTSTFDLAGRVAGQALYRVELVAPGGRSVTCDSGLSLHADGALEHTADRLDTLVVSGGFGHRDAAANPVIVAHVRRLAALARRVASVCTGTSVLAAAGLLDGRRATTHWEAARDLARRYPAVVVDPDPIYVRDGNVATSAGVTSALDLTLAFVQEDHGPRLARRVARGLVTYMQRPGDQAQVSMFVAADPPEHALVGEVVTFVTANVAGALDTTSLARRFGLSERQLTRLFVDHVGLPPGRFVRRTRVETAARLLDSTALPVAAVARRCGFGTAEALRQAFVDRFGIPPSRYRSGPPAGPRSGRAAPGPGPAAVIPMAFRPAAPTPVLTTGGPS
jgi:transcriptional regulator GlxA family with amidase domain